ncbi:MAG: competence/damage-inducible protein A [Candidatus Omnitrophota bacterium]
MQAEIVSIGTELLLGKTINTNAAYLSKHLATLGIDHFYQTTVGDNQIRLFTALKRALHRSDIVITTGGLGPTVDDITLETLAQVTQKKLILNPSVLKDITNHFQKRHLTMPKKNLRQALIPEGATPIKNTLGTAPGLLIPIEKKALIALPGVPQELKPMMEHSVVPYLTRYFAKDWVILSRSIKTTGLAECKVNQKVEDMLKLTPPLTVGIYAHTEGVELNITAKAKNKSQAKKLIAPIERKIRSRLKEYIYGEDAQTLEEVVARALTTRKKTVAVAESCTGGLVSQRLTNLSGSSRYFLLGLVAYDNKMKESLLNIPSDTLKEFGAVSEETAGLMAEHVRQLANSTLGLGITGIAGPQGATKDKPVGLVYIALATAQKKCCAHFYFHGDRNDIRLRAAQAALEMIRKHLVQ